MKEIGVNTSTLNSQADSIEKEVKAIRGDITRMYEAVQTLDSMWDGPASMAFKTQFNNDQQKMLELCDTIQSIVDSMKFAKKEYEDCENAVNGIIASIRV